MTQFKVGDRIRETFSKDKDTGVIVRPNKESPGSWYILWETGPCAREELWLDESDMLLSEVVPDLDGETITISGVQYRLTKI